MFSLTVIAALVQLGSESVVVEAAADDWWHHGFNAALMKSNVPSSDKKKSKKKEKKEKKEKKRRRKDAPPPSFQDLFLATGGKRLGMRARGSQKGKLARAEEGAGEHSGAPAPASTSAHIMPTSENTTSNATVSDDSVDKGKMVGDKMNKKKKRSQHCNGGEEEEEVSEPKRKSKKSKK